MKKRTGIKDVARLAGVSISTVSKALNRPDGVSQDIRVRVEAAVEELGYVPLQAAQQLRAGRSGLLGMTVINITSRAPTARVRSAAVSADPSRSASA